MFEGSLFIQTIGMVAFLVGTLGFLSKDDVRLKCLMGSAGLIIAVHFILLGAYAGAGAAAIAGVRGFLSIKHWAKPLAPVFFLVYVPLGFSAETYIDFLPIAAGLMGTYAMFFTSGIKMRVLFLFGTLLWLVHNGLKGSIGGTLLEVFFLAANTLTIYRMNNDEKS